MTGTLSTAPKHRKTKSPLADTLSAFGLFFCEQVMKPLALGLSLLTWILILATSPLFVLAYLAAPRLGKVH